MERKLTMKFKPAILAEWEAKHGGLSILSKVAPADIVKSVCNIMINTNQSMDEKIDTAYETINKIVSVSNIMDLIILGNLNTLDYQAAGDKLENYLEKYDDGIIGAYLQIIKELDADMKYLGIADTSLFDIIDLFKNKVNSIKLNKTNGDNEKADNDASE